MSIPRDAVNVMTTMFPKIETARAADMVLLAAPDPPCPNMRSKNSRGMSESSRNGRSFGTTQNYSLSEWNFMVDSTISRSHISNVDQQEESNRGRHGKESSLWKGFSGIADFAENLRRVSQAS